MQDVCALGELLIDFTDAGISSQGQKLFEQNPGGAPANVLVALERLGHHTAFLGKVGQDMHGAYLKQTLADAGVNTDGLIEDPAYFTTLAFVALSDTGERSFSFARKPGADTCLTKDEVAYHLIEVSRVFHVGSLSLTDEPVRTATLAALDFARKHGVTISYDPNYRASLWLTADIAQAQMRRVLPYAQLVKISQEECELLCGTSDVEGAAQKILDEGAQVVAITLDAEGALVATREGSCFVPSFACTPVDTTGAGDSFWGGFLAAWLELGASADETSLAQAEACARFANAVASLCVRGRGGIPSMPKREDVIALLASQKED